MKMYALADLHLAISVPEKDMAVFGPPWDGYLDKIEQGWKETVRDEDLVLIPGDITWAMRPDQAKKDLEWIDSLPGKKVISKGNHDYWWPSNTRLEELLPDSIQFVNGTAITIGDYTICGTRLWDVPGCDFSDIIDFKDSPVVSKTPLLLTKEEEKQNAKIYKRELNRLEMGLSSLGEGIRIAMVHYPPTTPALNDTEVTKLLEQYRVTHCVFGHLHNVIGKPDMYGAKKGVKYHLTSADYLQFVPKLIAS